MLVKSNIQQFTIIDVRQEMTESISEFHFPSWVEREHQPVLRHSRTLEETGKNPVGELLCFTQKRGHICTNSVNHVNYGGMLFAPTPGSKRLFENANLGSAKMW